MNRMWNSLKSAPWCVSMDRAPVRREGQPVPSVPLTHVCHAVRSFLLKIRKLLPGSHASEQKPGFA